MQKRKIGEIKQKNTQNMWPIVFKILLVLVSFVLIFFLSQPFAHHVKNFFASTAKGTVRVFSKAVGTPMQRDIYGNINVLLVGYGGAGHGGGYLADSTIVASWNPEKGALTMLSIPRDLYVKNPLGGVGRINSVFTQLYGRDRDLQQAAVGYAKEIEKITGLVIPYYATIDFSGFKDLIDSIGGIDIDVPYSLHDYQYPDENLKGYDPLHVEEGFQHMDGELALKYARSRHAVGHASDFDRSYRQQLVINAIKDKLLSDGNLTLSNAKQLYESYIGMVNTNVSLNEMLRTIQYLGTVKMYTFGLNTSYSYENVKVSQKGSFLYSPQRELFGGASVILPLGATANNLTHYDTIHEYADFISHLQEFLVDGAKIQVDNGIDKNLLRQYGLQNVKVAGRLAVKMKRFGLDVVETNNIDPQEKTTIIINTENSKSEGFEGTVKAIKNFLPIDDVVYNTGIVKSIIDDYGNEVEIFTGVDVQVVLGASYLSGLQNNKFKPETLEILYR